MKNIKNIIEATTASNNTNNLWLDKGVIKTFRNGQWITISEGDDKQELEEKVDALDKEMGEVKNDLSKFKSTQGIVELEIGDSQEIKNKNIEILKSIQSTDHTFFCDINYGYGTGQWSPTTGGQATVYTSQGVAVIYDIDKDGAVSKNYEYNLESCLYLDLSEDSTMDDPGYVNKTIATVYDVTSHVENINFDHINFIKIKLIVPLWYNDGMMINECILRKEIDEYRNITFVGTIADLKLRLILTLYETQIEQYLRVYFLEHEVLDLARVGDINKGFNAMWFLTKGASILEASKLFNVSSPLYLYPISRETTFSDDLPPIFITNETGYYRSMEYDGFIYELKWVSTENGVRFTSNKYSTKATTTTPGVVKAVASPAELSSLAELTEVTSRVNTIINSLISSGVFKSPE